MSKIRCTKEHAPSNNGIIARVGEAIVHYSIYGIWLFTFLSVIVCLIWFAEKYHSIFKAWEIVFIIPSIFLMICVYLIGTIIQKLPEWKIFLIMSSIGALFSIVMISTFNTQPCSDYKAIWDTAIKFAAGDFSAGKDPTNYMYMYNWQIGITFLESLIIRVFGNHFYVLKIINAITIITTDWCIYLFCKRKSNKRVACFSYSISVFLLPLILSIPQFTNHHATILLLLLVFWLLDTDSPIKWLIAGLLSSVLNVLRPYGIIIILSATCLTIFHIAKIRQISNNRKCVIKAVGSLLLFLVAYRLGIFSFDQFFIRHGIVDTPISIANVPYFKFQKGLYGLNSVNDGLKNFGYDYVAYNEAAKHELITTILNKPVQIVSFVLNKMCRYLGLFDYQFEMTYNQDIDFYTHYPVRFFYLVSWFQYIIMMIISFYAVCKRSLTKPSIYTIFFIGNTLVYFLIEAFSSYRFESYPLIVYFAAYSMWLISNNSDKNEDLTT